MIHEWQTNRLDHSTHHITLHVQPI